MELFASSSRKRRTTPPAPAAARGSSAPSSSAAAPASTATALSLADIEERCRGASFAELGLRHWLVDACTNLGMRSPTPVQWSCIPPILAGRDVIASAQTGSGKTAAFALPIIQKLAEDPYGIFAVVLTPTRELAIQIGEQFAALGKVSKVRHAVVIGGVSMVAQSCALQALPHIVVATPGRMAALIRGGTAIRLGAAKFLVFDEADRLLHPQFGEDLATIAGALPAKRQTLLFSATITADVEAVANASTKTPHRFAATLRPQTVQTLTQRYLFMPARIKMCYLFYLLKTMIWSDRDGADDDGVSKRVSSAIVFVSTCRMCHQLREIALELEMPCVCLHAQTSQKKRIAALHMFKGGKVPLLFATDVASRGLDIQRVELVLNFDVPNAPAEYVHRVGRTARAGRGGVAITLISQYDVKLVQSIEEYVGKKLEELEGIDEEKVLALMRKVSTAQRIVRIKISESDFDERVEERKKRRRTQRERSALHARAPTAEEAAELAQKKKDAAHAKKKRKFHRER